LFQVLVQIAVFYDLTAGVAAFEHH